MDIPFHSQPQQRLQPSVLSTNPPILPQQPSTMDELHNTIMRFHQLLRCYRDEKGRIISEHFKKLPLREEDPEYYELIKHPVSFLMIRNRIDKLKYTSIQQWLSDVELLLENARVINSRRPSAINSNMTSKDIEVLQHLLDTTIKPQIFGSNLPHRIEIEHSHPSIEGMGRFPLTNLLSESRIRFVQTLETITGKGQLHIGDSILFLMPSFDGYGAGRFLGWIVKLWKSSSASGCIVSIFLQSEQVTLDIKPPSSSAKEIFATPILKIILLPAIIRKVSIALLGANNLIPSEELPPQSTPIYHCNYLYDTGCNRIYNCNFSLLSQSKGASIISERKDDTFSILPSLQNSLQLRKRVGESIKVGCTFLSTCSRTFNLLEGLCRHASDHILQLPELLTTGMNTSRIPMKQNILMTKSLSHVTSSSQKQQQCQSISALLPQELACCFDTDKSGKLIWFSSPPLNVLEKEPSIHSADYLLWQVETEPKDNDI